MSIDKSKTAPTEAPKPAEAPVTPAELTPAEKAKAALAAAAAPPAASEIVNTDENGVILDHAPIILMKDYSQTIATLRQSFEKEDGNKVYDISQGWVAASAKKLSPCIVIASANDNNDVMKVLTVLKALKVETQNKKVKFIVISKFKHGAVIEKFKQFGCQEFIVEPIPDRTLEFKMKLHVNSLRSLRKKRRMDILRQKESEAAALKKKEADSQKKKKNGEAADGSETKRFGAGTKKKSGTDKDKWVFKSSKKKNDPNAPEKETETLPDPAKGEWKEITTADGKKGWKFEDKDGQSWEYEGDVKPEFKDGGWAFEGKMPKLKHITESGEEEVVELEAETAEYIEEKGATEDAEDFVDEVPPEKTDYPDDYVQKHEEGTLLEFNKKKKKSNKNQAEDFVQEAVEMSNRTEDFVEEAIEDAPGIPDFVDEAPKEREAKDFKDAADVDDSDFNDFYDQVDEAKDEASRKNERKKKRKQDKDGISNEVIELEEIEISSPLVMLVEIVDLLHSNGPLVADQMNALNDKLVDYLKEKMNATELAVHKISNGKIEADAALGKKFKIKNEESFFTKVLSEKGVVVGEVDTDTEILTIAYVIQDAVVFIETRTRNALVKKPQAYLKIVSSVNTLIAA